MENNKNAGPAGAGVADVVSTWDMAPTLLSPPFISLFS